MSPMTRNKKFWFWLGVIGSLASIVGLVLGFFSYFSSVTPPVSQQRSAVVQVSSGDNSPNVKIENNGENTTIGTVIVNSGNPQDSRQLEEVANAARDAKQAAEKAEKTSEERLRALEDVDYQEKVREAEDGMDFFTSGDLDVKQTSIKESMKLLESLGRKEGIAKSYLALGAIAQKKNDTVLARQYWEKALSLYKDANIPHMVRRMEERLKTLSGRS